MSSEGSVTSSGSRIRQFGLYRTIDARTEEFMRSSRKRQIRQGCACAAISTAITVTVVVSVILVYEYSINSNSNNANKKNSLKPNWVGLMNDSDITSISSKFNKKVNFDRTTLKLLPILLKALNKNRYLEKILEEYSSATPPYAGQDSTEATLTRNIFSYSKNWLKLPTTRHYSTDYKTSPLMHWQTPTQRLEYLTKIRKIRDYQRMLNYFDKMINDKVGLKKEFDHTEHPLTAETVPIKKTDTVREIQQLPCPTQKARKEIKTEGNDLVLCSCPKKLGLLLSKLVASLQDLIPQIIGDKLGLNSCKKKTKHVKALKQFNTARTMPPTKHRVINLSTVAMRLTRKTLKKSLNDTTTTTKKNCCITRSTSAATSTSTSTAITRTTPSTTTTVTEISTTPAYNEIKPMEKNIIQEPDQQTSEKTSTNYSPLVTITESSYVQTNKSPEVKHRITETTEPMKFISKSSSDKWLQAYALDMPYPRLNLPSYKEEEYDDYFNYKPSKMTEFQNINFQSMESLRNKATSPPEDMGLGVRDNVKPMNNNPATGQQDLDLTSMRKLADMIYLPEEKIAKVWQYTIEPELSLPSHKTYKHTDLQVNSQVANSVESSVDPTTEQQVTSYSFASTLQNFETTNASPDVTSKHYASTLKYQPNSFSTYQLAGDNGGDDEFQDEDTHTSESNVTAYKYKNTSTRNVTEIENKKLDNPWMPLKSEEKTITKSSSSMLPSLKPIYLEIQRNNEWRQDDRGDYDLYNFNSNIFDLPSVE